MYDLKALGSSKCYAEGVLPPKAILPLVTLHLQLLQHFQKEIQVRPVRHGNVTKFEVECFFIGLCFFVTKYIVIDFKTKYPQTILIDLSTTSKLA